MRLSGLDGALSRRAALGTLLLTQTFHAPGPFGGPSAARAAAGYSQQQILALLSRVPAFVVTNGKSEPYLTDRGPSGRSGTFYLAPRDALEVLQQIRAFDPAASLSIVPLDDIWPDIPKDAAAAVKTAAAADQPKAGTSTDMRLFKLAPASDEVTRAAGLAAGVVPDGGVPLFYNPTLQLSIDGTRQVPYFFRTVDYRTTWGQTQPEGSNDDPPRPRVTSLAALAVTLAATGIGAGESPPVLVAGSDAAALVDRMGRADEAPSSDAGGGPGGGDPAAPDADDPFWARSVPFGGGRLR